MHQKTRSKSSNSDFDKTTAGRAIACLEGIHRGFAFARLASPLLQKKISRAPCRPARTLPQLAGFPYGHPGVIQQLCQRYKERFPSLIEASC